MNQDRDDYMRRQDADHALLDMRVPGHKPTPHPSVVSATTVRTETTRRVELGDVQILELLASRSIYVPKDATITVTVPGGGDWSNTDLDINDRCPVVVSWTEVVQS